MTTSVQDDIGADVTLGPRIRVLMAKLGPDGHDCGAKLVALCKAAARTNDDLWKAVGTVCDLFTNEECLNYFIAARYEPDWT